MNSKMNALLLLFSCCFIICINSQESDEEPPKEKPFNICDKYPSLRQCWPSTTPGPPTTPTPQPLTTQNPTTAAENAETTSAANICDKYPSLKQCQPSPTPSTPPITKPPDPYCVKNNAQFSEKCEKNFTDVSQKEFCNNYGVRCKGWKRMNQPKNFGNVKPGESQRSWPRMNAGPGGGIGEGRTNEDIQYCRSYGKDYYRLCRSGSAQNEALAFCQDFAQTCPGVPGGAGGGNSGNPPLSDSQMNDQQYCEAYKYDYYNMCLTKPIPENAKSFCQGFIKTCPFEPRPGSRG